MVEKVDISRGQNIDICIFRANLRITKGESRNNKNVDIVNQIIYNGYVIVKLYGILMGGS